MPEKNKEIEEKTEEKVKNSFEKKVKNALEKTLSKDPAVKKTLSNLKKNSSGEISDNLRDNLDVNKKDAISLDNNNQGVSENNVADKLAQDKKGASLNRDQSNLSDQRVPGGNEDGVAGQLAKNKKEDKKEVSKKGSDVPERNKNLDKNRKGPEIDSRPVSMRENLSKKDSPENLENNNKSTDSSLLKKDENPNINDSAKEAKLNSDKKDENPNINDSAKEAKLNSDKKKEKASKASKASADSKGNAASGIEKLTKAIDELLKAAWENLIDSFGLTLLYIYLHWFMHQLFPKFFCDLGQEWVPKKVKSVAPDKAKIIGKKIGLAEKGLVGCTCVILLFAFIFAVFSTILLLVILFPHIFAIGLLWEIAKDLVAGWF